MADTLEGREGDVAIIASQYFEVPGNFCLLFHLYMKSLLRSTEYALRIYLRPQTHPHAMPFFLHEYPGHLYKRWDLEKLTLPAGQYQIWFHYTMGFAYGCAAAFDNVRVEACDTTPEVLMTESQNGQSFDKAYSSMYPNHFLTLYIEDKFSEVIFIWIKVYGPRPWRNFLHINLTFCSTQHPIGKTLP